jgi:4-hydroxysphinganine ceramide fatty acyl 2-hydroxylase
MPPREREETTETEFEWEEIRRHDKDGDAWVVLRGGVYNVSNFLKDHPGGGSIVMPHLGGDIEEVFADEDYHEHSKAAYKILEQYRIGYLAGTASLASGKTTAHSSVDGGADVDGTEVADIDWTKPIVMQVGKLGKKYNEFVHDPVVLDEPARFFGPDWMEPFSRTSWWVIPGVWGPVICGGFLYSIKLGLSPVEAACSLAVGVAVWTWLEYVLHRFVFHLDEAVQFSWWSITLHFLLHGVHHKLPQDPMRLVMPPVITAIILIPVYHFFSLLAKCFCQLHLPVAITLTCGGLLGYVGYDLTHYYLHHAGISPDSYIGKLKRYHMAHHYQNPKLGFGITSKFWDRIFGTVLHVKEGRSKAAAKTE